MQNKSRGDVLKVWIYAVSAIFLGAWFSPFLYNSGKALAEVAENKTTNAFIDWLAGWCRTASFSQFFKMSLCLAAALLFLPWMQSLCGRRNIAKEKGPWRLRLPEGARSAENGQELRLHIGKSWQFFVGFFCMALLLFALEGGLSFSELIHVGKKVGVGLILRGFLVVCVFALFLEIVFRGVVLGIFLRGMSHRFAIILSSVFFALVLAVFPSSEVRVINADASGTGFEMLRLLAARFTSFYFLCRYFAPLLALGGVLAFARWRTAALWLSTGIHTGWIVSKEVFTGSGGGRKNPLFPDLFFSGFAPLAALILTGFLIYILGFRNHEKGIGRS